jgi:hypothetical protein
MSPLRRITGRHSTTSGTLVRASVHRTSGSLPPHLAGDMVFSIIPCWYPALATTAHLMPKSAIALGHTLSRSILYVVHLIKSFNSQLQGNIPTTLQYVRNQVAACQRMINSLTSKEDMAMGGLWIEVTVQAATLKDTYRAVKKTHLLEPAFSRSGRRTAYGEADECQVGHPRRSACQCQLGL